MPTGAQRSAYEAQLAQAHRALYRAATRAYDMGDEGAAQDCESLNIFISQLMETSLKGQRRPATRQQTLAI